MHSPSAEITTNRALRKSWKRGNRKFPKGLPGRSEGVGFLAIVLGAVVLAGVALILKKNSHSALRVEHSSSVSVNTNERLRLKGTTQAVETRPFWRHRSRASRLARSPSPE